LNALTPSPCNTTVAEALDARHVPASIIRDLSYTARIRRRTATITAWMGLEGQPGHLVVDMAAPSCYFEEIYTDGGAVLLGIANGSI
jgi:hypothetical protein